MLVGVRQTGQTLYNLLRLEAGAQSLPASTPFLLTSLSLYGLSEFGLASLSHGTAVSLLAGLIAVLLLAVLTTMALTFAGYSSRVMQTLSALAAAGAVVDCSRFILQLLLQAAVPVANLGTFLLFPLLVWHFLICAYVYRGALARGSIHSRGLALAYVLSLVALRRSLDVWA
jgi:hypothetical protein